MPSAAETPAIALAKPGFYRSQILRILQGMTRGRLRLTLPEGAVLEFGDGQNEVRADVHVRRDSFFQRCVLYGDIGFGEGYTDGDWDTSDITSVIKWFLLNIDNNPAVSGGGGGLQSVALNLLKFVNRITHFARANSVSGSRKNISAHYDLNNEFFSLFLDPTMTYSSAYFQEPDMTLEEAQYAKYDRLCRQLQLQPSDHVLEIGSGWGANAIYMAKRYGCRVTSATISEEQFKLATDRVRQAGLSDRVQIIFEDYRKITGVFDKIVSVEMLEAVGAKFLPIYFKTCAERLKQNGILAFQVITCPDARFDALRRGVDWIQKYIFPGSLLPSVGAINEAVNDTSDLSLVDLKDMGLDYARTLAMWRDTFREKLGAVRKLGFDEAFIRKWEYYLSYCEAAFAMRNIYVMQLVYTRPNNTGR